MPITQNQNIILASASAVRAKMLRDVGLNFSVIPSSVDEDAIRENLKNKPISTQALELAKAKLIEVSKDYPDSIVIAADQICELDGKIYCKPGVKENAISHLQDLRGNKHHQHSGVCIAKGGDILWEYVDSVELNMRNLSDDEIESYVKLDNPIKAAGSYKFEEHGRHLFNSVNGDHDSIKGLPMVRLLSKLYELKVIELG